MITKNDLWYLKATKEGSDGHARFFILDASRVPNGSLTESDAAMEALSVVCSDALTPSSLRWDHVDVVVYRINGSGVRDVACSASATLEGRHYIDHQGDRVRSRDPLVFMFPVGDSL